MTRVHRISTEAKHAYRTVYDKPAQKADRKPVVIDTDALAAERARLDALAQQPAMLTGSGRAGRTADGACHECGRDVTGERWYCGRCMARRA